MSILLLKLMLLETNENKIMSTGLHLNLTEGRPLSRPEDISSLLTTEGNFLGREGFQHAVADGHIDLEEVCFGCSILSSLPTVRVLCYTRVYYCIKIQKEDNFVNLKMFFFYNSHKFVVWDYPVQFHLVIRLIRNSTL